MRTSVGRHGNIGFLFPGCAAPQAARRVLPRPFLRAEDMLITRAFGRLLVARFAFVLVLRAAEVLVTRLFPPLGFVLLAVLPDCLRPVVRRTAPEVRVELTRRPVREADFVARTVTRPRDVVPRERAEVVFRRELPPVREVLRVRF